MKLQRLEVRNFRNYAHQVVEAGPRLNLFVGPNAQGKSNLLEALYAVASTRSVRTNREEELIRWGETFARVDARLTSDARVLQAEIIWQKEAGTALKKTARVNRQDIRRYSQLFEVARMVLFSAEDLDLVAGPPVERRRLLDYLLCKTSALYLEALQQYSRVLRERNSWLQHRRGNLKAVLDEQLLDWGRRITDQRHALAVELSTGAADYYTRLTHTELPFRIDYLPSLPAHEHAEAFLASRAEAEFRRGTTLVGPHRDDLAILLGGSPLRSFGSRGQLRCTALALRLAEGDLMRQKSRDSVVYLMDDCMSELDGERQRFLWEHLQTRDQVFLTGTPDSLTHLPPLDVTLWHVEAGRLVASP